MCPMMSRSVCLHFAVTHQMLTGELRIDSEKYFQQYLNNFYHIISFDICLELDNILLSTTYLLWEE